MPFFDAGSEFLGFERPHEYGRCWPLDLALWDLAGKILGQPCWRLLGGLWLAAGEMTRQLHELRDLRDFLMTELLRADAAGWLHLGEAPGMGYAPDEERLSATRIA